MAPSRSLLKFRLASLAARAVPLPVLRAAVERGAARFGPRFMGAKAAQLGRHIQRVDPTLSDEDVDAAVARGIGSYGRYWVESFRLPTLSTAATERHFVVEGYPYVQKALDSGIGPILVLPHLGGWEWAAAWLERVKGEEVSAVVEVLEPADVFEWFIGLREAYGIDVIPVGPDAMARLVKAVKAKRIVCLLSDRDLAGNGVEVEFFGEKTTLPAGPALLARRTGAPLLPTAVYFDGKGHLGRVEAPIHASPEARLRDDIARVTQELATAMEGLISAAPDQWHLLEPNWPSDHAR